MILIELITVWILRRLLIIVYVLFSPARMRLMPLFRLSQAQRRPSYALLSWECRWQRIGLTRRARRGDCKSMLSYGMVWYGIRECTSPSTVTIRRCIRECALFNKISYALLVAP